LYTLELEYKCYMGIFSQIDRAWATIDNKFFIWSYLYGSDFVEYDDLDQVIICVGLVKPKADVFKDIVEYLLVLATPVEIVLVAVTVSKKIDSNQIEITLLPTNYSVPTDNVNILKISGTSNGRIFLTGQDGCLYEFEYESDEGWIRKTTRKVNHSRGLVKGIVPSFLRFSTESPLIDLAIDNERNLLYTLSEDSTIEMWDLGTSCDSISKVATYTVQQLCKDASQILRSDFKLSKLLSIYPVLISESHSIHLTAVSITGERFFFSSSEYISSKENRPKSTKLVKVRTRTVSNEITYSVTSSERIHEVYYNRGVFIMADSKGEDLDNLICFSYQRCKSTLQQRQQQQLEEISSSADVYGRSHAISEVQIPIKIPVIGCFNELATQHANPAREFVCMSNNGIHLLVSIIATYMIESYI
jgi:nuclear pore complex protein Nup155